MTNDASAIEAAMKLAALDWNVYGRALEDIKEGRVSAEEPEELRRYLEFARDMERKLDKARTQLVQGLLSGQAQEETVRQFYNQLQIMRQEFIQAMKTLKVKHTTSPSHSEIIDLVDLTISSIKDPTERAEAQRIREVLYELMNELKEGLV